ncbi:retrovirus-related Pol polyprotein from transposon TNT 1-94 [Senna tora]|uniref:Retrovirus-related Pol polyprotein from transposon TNT 1-94 n=1 Tax=Senna tora TaxID=362788 RepID=A0A834WJ25_9FABA|nr:retrovirus-related Pol polyprotein from transposon TNT 1-94 [Senna tora]
MADTRKEDERSSVSASKSSNPYTLTANENPENLITQVELRGENYEEWARAVRTALRAKKKHGFVDGTVTQPANDSSKLEDWWVVNSMLVSWVRNTIEPTLRSTISHMENVKDLWEDIRQHFSMGNGPRVQQLRSDLANCKLNGEAIVTYYGKLKMLWDELGNYEQIPVCSCTGCKCDVAAKLEKKAEEDKVHQFLMGLDEEGYGTLRSNILSTEPLPNLNRVYAMTVQEEQVKTVMKTKEERGNPMSFVIQEGVRNKGKTMTCSNYKREGHDTENCFQLIGYPEWWGNRSRTGNGRGGDASKETMEGLSGLNDEQWSTLLGMLNSHKNGSSERLMGKHKFLSWIINTGASHHMTGTRTCLSHVRNIKPCPVGLPNGDHATTLKQGTVFLGKKLELRNVLFVPNLNCNLISVSQLVADSSLVVQFTDKLCVIQDRNSRTMIGADLNTMGENLGIDPLLEQPHDIEELDDSDGHEENLNDEVVGGNIVSEAPLGRGQRTKYPSTRLQDYVTHTIKLSPSTSSSLHPSSACTPLEQNHKLALSQSLDVDDPSRYRRFVGRLIYLTITRPELSYCVHILAQFMQQPKQDHWEAALRVVRYLKGNPGQGILLDATCDLRL